jgi:hypothetical protein
MPEDEIQFLPEGTPAPPSLYIDEVHAVLFGETVQVDEEGVSSDPIAQIFGIARVVQPDGSASDTHPFAATVRVETLRLIMSGVEKLEAAWAASTGRG